MTNRRITWFEVAILSMGSSYLLLLKQMGLPLYLMILFLLTVISMMRNPGWRQRIQNRDDGIRILLDYAASLYERSSMEHFGEILTGILRDLTDEDETAGTKMLRRIRESITEEKQ